MHTLEEVGREADTVRSEIELLYVRGLASSTPAERSKLSRLASEWERLGAGHVASRLLEAVQKADADAKDAPRALLSAYTSLHVFERVLSLEAAAEAWTAHLAALQAEGEEGEESAEEGERESGAEEAGLSRGDPSVGRPKAPDKPVAGPPQKPVALPPIEDPVSTLALVEELSRAVEDLVRTGLTSATESTRAKLDASFKEASRRKLLRLGASLRFVNDDIARFLADDPAFSVRRFGFFLHRSWMIARGLAAGIHDKNARVITSMTVAGGAAPRPIGALEVVTLGVLKRTIVSNYTFEFRLRVVGGSEPDLVGKSLTWGIVFQRTKENARKGLPPEAHLHLPQPQGFTPKIFLDGNVVTLRTAAVALDERGNGRLLLGPPSKVTAGGPYSDWKALYRFDPRAAHERVLSHPVSPLDLAPEMQEEVFVAEPSVGEAPMGTNEGRRVYALTGAGGLSLDIMIPDNPYDKDGEETLSRLRASVKSGKDRLLYGVAYYEFGRTVFLPLSVMNIGGPAKEPPPEPEAKARGKGKTTKPQGGRADKAAQLRDATPDLVTISKKSFDLQDLVGNLRF